MERGQSTVVGCDWYPIYPKTKWGRDCISRKRLSEERESGSLVLTSRQDLGNTNYSIHVSRSSFDRKVTAEVIVRAVRSLGIDAGVNDRNDICAGEYKISHY